jgi:hypothetical protein
MNEIVSKVRKEPTTPFERWLDFATRMVDKVYASYRTKAEIRENVIAFIESYKGEEILGWDESYISDSVKEYFDDIRWKNPNGDHDDLEESKLYQNITAIIRASLDVAVKPSAGVGGFTVGDLRKMYPEGLPEWVQQFFEHPIGESAKNAEPVWL